MTKSDLEAGRANSSNKYRNSIRSDVTVLNLFCGSRVHWSVSVHSPTTDHRVWYHLCLLLLVRQAGYIVNSLDFYSYRLIGKLTAFLQFQEFSQRNLPVVSSTSAARSSHSTSKAKLAWLLSRHQPYVST
jgi:hypothetical protein